MNRDQPVRPANIINIVEINQGRRPLTLTEPEARPLGIAAVEAHVAAGGVLVDARSQASFGAGHVPGSYNVQQSSPEFEQRVGWITPLDAPTVLVLENDADAADALHRLAFVGLDARVQGFLSGGVGGWIRAGRPVETVPQQSVRQLHEQLSGENGRFVLDVREPEEWEAGHIDRAHNVSFKVLGDHIDALPVDREATLSVVCAGGLRSSTACSILRRHGFGDVTNVTGGMTAWEAAELPVVTEAATC